MKNGNEEPRLLAVEVRDFRGCRFAHIDFTKAITLLGGKNEAGKTSVIEGIRALMAGDRALPAFPIHDEATSARLFADLGTMTIEKVIADGKKPTLVVKDMNGQKVPAPQQALAEMYDSMSFDPSEFVTMKPEQQDEELRAAIGLDLTDIEADVQIAFNARAEVNREVKRLEGRLTEKTHYADAPAEETTTAAAVAELENHDRWAAGVNTLSSGVAAAKRAEADARAALESALVAHTRAKESLEHHEKALSLAPPCPTAPRDEIERKLSTLDAENAKVRSNRERAAISKELQAKKAESAAKTEKLDALEKQKAERIAGAKFPIDGLTFDPKLGPMFNGHPLKQCGEAEMWLLSCALCMVRNPKLKFLLIRRGSQLDDDALKKLYALAEEKDFKLLVEVVTKRPEDEAGVDVMMRNGTGTQQAEA